ncbi:MAG: hypothetical protein A3H35_08815 [Betaproteobacteria bacterium RIFCSPLOWO2_02_FULL_62_17]|nr:MAG: hypothetical protein A3H35_08815 [Betaproteobacteria bacterium RIFCSPLOWO2_02_FULL_62_17]
MNLIWNLLRRGGRTRRPASATVPEMLGQARSRLGGGHLAAAQIACEDVLQREPRNPEATHLLGMIAYQMRDWTVALELMERSIDLDAANAYYLNNLGALLCALGRAEEAVAVYRRALIIAPTLEVARSNLLFALPFLDETTGASLRAEHETWARMHIDPGRALPKAHANTRDPDRRLRVGYVSADFRDHAVSLFFEPMIASHDRREVEIFCYYNNTAQDAVTARIRGCADHWRDLPGMDDDHAAALIRSDSIDVLIDLSGHLKNNRLQVFARRPAPIQMSYVGYLSTTGLAQIDYRITDALCDPPGMTDDHYTERLLRLPGCMWCYRPPAEAGEVSALPARRAGVVTFASTNNPAKITERMLRLWAMILERVPGSRLLVAGTPAPGRSRMTRVLEQCGIACERIVFEDRLSHQEFWRLHARGDIVLDTFPFNGGTTTCEALWMGVPVVSLCGERMHSRAGASLLTASGLQDLAVSSGEDYVRAAVALAMDLDRLESLRTGMRGRLRASSLIDAPRFVRGLEGLYRSAWRAWCRD